MQVRDILDTKGSEVVTTAPDVALHSVARVLSARRIGAVVVLDGASVIGILSERDIVAAVASGGPEALGRKVADVMTREVISCVCEDTIETVMCTMTDRRVRHMPVLENGRMTGVISIGDVVKLRLGEIEGEARMLRDYIEAR